jgi:4-amino-4-deoxy-L-arabinose transferase-like glycosyltransferase
MGWWLVIHPLWTGLWHDLPVSQPTPALVTHRAAKRLPRLALLLLCAAYVLPGLFGRDPWRNADLTAFGTMLALAEGRTPWLSPALGGVPVDSALLPHWLGAGFITLLGDWMDPALAARLPFAALLALTLALIWYATFHLARTEAAQPVAFAFGGEADPVDYARALADGALLATVSTLGLLQLGHETTPELVQLSEVALLLWALAAAPFRVKTSRAALLVALPALALSGAPSMALAWGVVGMLTCRGSSYPTVRELLPWVAAATGLALLLATLTGAWHWRLSVLGHWSAPLSQPQLLLWFTWPTWPLALWTLWRWRQHWRRRHIAVPLGMATVGVLASIAMGSADRALMLALPGLTVLAAFALPTLQRSTGAAIDWFSVFFFSAAAITVWVIYASMQAGLPAQPLANIQRLAPGFVPRFNALALALAVLGSVAWLWLVRWRTARHQHALWKSLVLPAGGVALSWLLTMTLLLPVLDYARSPRALVDQLIAAVPPGSCVLAPDQSAPQVAALEVFGRYKVLANPSLPLATSTCAYLVLQGELNQPPPPPAGWDLLLRARRPTDRNEATSVFRRQPG